MTKLEEFLGRCMDAFVGKFPYRHPDTNPAQIPERLRHLQYPQSEWPGTFRERLRNKFNDFSRQKRDRRKSGLPSDEDDEDESDGNQVEEASDEDSTIEDAASLREGVEMGVPEGTDENENEEAEQEITEGGGAEAKLATGPPDEMDAQSESALAEQPDNARTKHAALVSAVAARKEFRPYSTTYDSWENAFKQLAEMGEKNWAECDPEELESRQENVPNIVHNLLDLLYYTTGYELYATGVVLSKGQGFKFDATTPRSKHFSEHPDGSRARDSFTQFANTYIGPALCTNIHCPAPVVYPDPSRENHPTFPAGIIATHEQRQRLLVDYLSYSIAWQGGGAFVPYDIIAQQHEEGNQDIIDNSVLPLGVEYPKNPMLMEPKELEVMISHIIAGDQNKIPAHQQFRFEQSAPGMFASNYSAGRYPQATMFYRPDSQVYTVALEENARLTSSPRTDGLPSINEYEEPYQSFTEESIRTYQTILRPEDCWWGLLGALQEHDKLFPAQMEVRSGVHFTFEPSHIQQVDATIEALRHALQNSSDMLQDIYSSRRISSGHEFALRNATAAHSNVPTSPAQFNIISETQAYDPWDDTLSEVERSAWYEHSFAETSAKMSESAEASPRNVGTSEITRRATKRAASTEQIPVAHVRRRTTNESGEEDEDMHIPDESDVKGKATVRRRLGQKEGRGRASSRASRSTSKKRGGSKSRGKR
ncbi:hypothetical protein RSAG8_07189, partial [Rhizoctonia solani AG-8 WAC10335]